ncbi:hypothetical protein [Methylobacterium nonmethylotrophicum]|uniref:Uncharacterized protein n=1 Tax=Methylobacterium nonmethylotrophicum TaxID=1141884 RepID=A0A4Z0NDP3_9HYPH|nr:hypothetical protein [Methylobacterium nonmethylotrophicum]TGD93718.1 hypothetical protein EU555_33050 [Methylobacterium nonmethylotrophicum]
MDLLAGQAKVCDGCRQSVPVRNAFRTAALGTSDLAPLLRRVVLVGEPALGERLDLDGIGGLLAAAEDGSGARRAVVLA